MLVVGGVQWVSDDGIEVRIEAIDRLGQHRMAEAIDRVRELRHDRRIEVDVIDLGRREEGIDHRLDGACELLEHEVLVLHLGAELRHLEQALAVPSQRIDLRLSRRQRRHGRQQPLVEEGQVVRLDARRDDRIHRLIDEAVVLGVENVVDGRQADVLVHAAIAGDVVRVEQLVVVCEIVSLGIDGDCVSGDSVSVRDQHAARVENRHGTVRNVDQELVARAHGVREVDRRWLGCLPPGRRRPCRQSRPRPSS